MNTRYPFVSLVLLIVLSACSSKVVVREVASKDPNKAWSRVLATYVDKKGRVDFRALDKNRSDLEAYITYVSKHSPKATPKSFPDRASQIAYYLNSYNALVMYNVLHYEIPEDNDGFFSRLKFFALTKYKIGGEFTSLYSYENDVIRPMDEPRVHVALNCMVRGCPRLPQTPFTAKGLEAELQSQALEFYNEDRNVQVDHKKKEVRLSEILDFFTEDFTPKHAPSLIAYVNKYRKEKIPENYEVEFIPYDWTVNIQPGKEKRQTASDR